MTTGRFPSGLYGASKKAGILQDPGTNETQSKRMNCDNLQIQKKKSIVFIYLPKRYLKICSLSLLLIFMKSPRPLKYSLQGTQSGFSAFSVSWQGQQSLKKEPCWRGGNKITKKQQLQFHCFSRNSSNSKIYMSVYLPSLCGPSSNQCTPQDWGHSLQGSQSYCMSSPWQRAKAKTSSSALPLDASKKTRLP